jgi:glycosyltransferase involved in cell wall biosynthesis
MNATADDVHRALIPAVAGSAPRPRWSVMIPTHNCATFLRDALNSVLSQDPGMDQMQIEVVDDHSLDDDPGEVVREIGNGRVGFFRQPENVGHTRNFETCLRRSRGRLIHQLHGDDGVLPGFYGKLERVFEEHPEVGAAFTRHIFMDHRGHWQFISALEQPESGILDDWLDRIAVEQRLQTPAMVVRREVYEDLGGFDRRLSFCEDWEMWVRIAAHYPVWYEVEPLALYRMNPTSHSKSAFRTGESARDLRRAISIQRSYLPPARVEELSRKAERANALATVRRGHEMVELGDLGAAIRQAREGIRSDPSPLVIRRALRLVGRIARRGAARIRTPKNVGS